MTACLTLTLPRSALAVFEEGLAGLGGAITTGPLDGDGPVAVALYLAEPPDAAALAALVAACAAAAGIGAPAYTVEAVPDRDWVAESQKALPAIQAGRIYLHGAHVAEPAPANAMALLVEAGNAFGTGRHETTRGCLLTLQQLARRRKVKRALDMGCGSGVLAMAMARLWNCRVLAVDNDPQAVRVCAENAALNGVAGRIHTHRSVGYRSFVVARAAPFDLIAANILARPLCDMAADLHRHLVPGGHAVLSGLLVEQEREVLARHRSQGLRLVDRLHVAEWSTLLLRR